MTDIEQDLLIELLSLNRGHLSPEYKITEAAFDDRCEVGFILPIGGLNVKDIIRLSKPKGCLLCGEETHSTCSACLSAQYCGKGEVRCSLFFFIIDVYKFVRKKTGEITNPYAKRFLQVNGTPSSSTLTHSPP